MIVLCGDIGATNSRLAVIQITPEQYFCLHQETYKNQNFNNFSEILQVFREIYQNKISGVRITAACFGVAGPIENQGTEDASVLLTNLNWTLSAREVGDFMQIQQVHLINDLEAIAHGLILLKKEETISILPGKPSAKGSHRAVIAPGSGIGESILFWDGNFHFPMATEGGHCSFSANGELQIQLQQYLAKEFQHVSWERVISGPGILNIYKFLHSRNQGKNSPEQQKIFNASNPSAAITAAAVAKSDALCSQTVDLFLEILANESANLALKCLPRGGLFIAGGIVPRLANLIDRENFMKAFTGKGRMSPVLAEIPVHLVVNDTIGMPGAARFAFLRAL